MSDLIETFCSYLSSEVDPTINTHQTDLIKLLNKTKILQKADPLKKIACNLCEQDHLAKVLKLTKGYYVNCEYTGLTKRIKEKALLNYKLNPIAVCKWLKSRLALENASTHVSGTDYHHLGSTTSGKPDFDIYITFSDNLTLVKQTFEGLINPYKILIWCGEKPHHGKVNKYLIPLNKILTVTKGKLEINKTPFAELIETISLKETTKSLLRSDIQLEKEGDKHYLSVGKNTSFDTFNDRHSISPQSFKLLKIFQKRGVGLELQDLVDAEVSTNKRTISTRIKDLNTLCYNSNVEPVLKKTDKTHWKLNSPLDGE